MTDLAPAVLLEAPRLLTLGDREGIGSEEGDDDEGLDVAEGGLQVYTCDARVEPFGGVVQAIALPPAPGWFVPWRKGDRVLLGLSGGGSGYILGWFAAHEADRQRATSHTVLRPTSGGDLRLGPPVGEWQRLALFDRLSAEVVSLKAQIDAIVDYLGSTSPENPIGSASPAGVVIGIEGVLAGLVSLATIEGGITGGDATTRVRASKA